MQARRVFASLLLICLTPLHADAADAGFYVGIEGGQSRSEIGPSDDVLIFPRGTLIDSSSDRTDQTFGLYGAYAFTRHVAIEIAYADLSEASYTEVRDFPAFPGFPPFPRSHSPHVQNDSRRHSKANPCPCRSLGATSSPPVSFCWGAPALPFTGSNRGPFLWVRPAGAPSAHTLPSASRHGLISLPTTSVPSAESTGSAHALDSALRAAQPFPVN